jgi:hypothetical protein
MQMASLGFQQALFALNALLTLVVGDIFESSKPI